MIFPFPCPLERLSLWWGRQVQEINYRNLIPRFYDVNAGRIAIDGTDIRDVTFASLKVVLPSVTQEIRMFDDTVRANIAYGRPNASDDEIFAAAKHAAAHDFIMDMPDGYDTYVGERGTKVSGGQRQRSPLPRLC